MAGLEGKKIFIVLCHPEQTSFSHAIWTKTKEVLESNGCIVTTSDLYLMNFDPVNDRRNYMEIKDSLRFNQQTEEAHAQKNGKFAPAIKAEMDKLMWCDYLIFISPIHWFSLPAMLKGWVDKVFASSFAYGGNEMYDKGKFVGKKALLIFTTGGPDFLYRANSLQGDINHITFPITHGMFYFCGFTPLKPYVVFSPTHGGNERRVKLLDDVVKFMQNLANATELRYPKISECIMSPTGPTLPSEDSQTRMITVANTFITAWVADDKEAMSKSVLDDFNFVLPAAKIRTSSFLEAYAIRQHRGQGKLMPHTMDTHTFPSLTSLKAYMHVFNASTGERMALAEITAEFDETCQRIRVWNQDMIFAK